MPVKRVVLANGLTLLFEPTVQKSSAIDIAVRFGSAFEPKEKAGIAHFIEHMFFTGTPSRNRKQVFQEIEGVGGELNAFTLRQSTHYYSKLLGRHFFKAVNVLNDCFDSCLFSSNELKLERKIILNEIRDSIDRPLRFVVDEFLADCLPQDIGRRIIGSMESVKAISREDLIEWFEKAYAAENTVIGITANEDPERLIEEFLVLGGKRKRRLAKKEFPKLKPELKRREIERKTEQAHLCLGFPVMTARDEQFYAFALVEALLGGGISSRLVQEIREKKGLSYMVQTLFEVESDYGFFLMYAAAKPSRVEEIERIALQEFEKIAKGDFTEKELQRAKNYVEGKAILAMENSENRARWLVNTELFGWKDFDEWIKRIKSVSVEEVRSTAEKYLDSSAYVLTVLKPK